MKISPDLTLPEVLAIAIKAEINAQELYRLMASRIVNSAVQEKFLHLALQEQKHEEILTAKYQEATQGEKPVLPKIGRSEVENKIYEDYSHTAALKLALQAEEAAANFYLEAAKTARDVNGRFMFEYLANFERGHKVILEDELSAIETNPHWFDVEGIPWGEQSIHVGP